MNTIDKESLIEKIRKLRAKAEDASVGEAEAALYAQKVAQLLQQYNLTEASLEVEQQEEVTEGRFPTGKGNDPWAQQLAMSVARLYFCEIYISRLNQRVKFVFVGKPHNIEIALSMTDYLIKTVGRLASAYAKSPEAKRDFDWTFTRARNGFERGAGERLRRRLSEMYQAQAKAAAPQRSDKGNPSNLPALYDDENKLVKKYLESMKLRAGRGRGSSTGGQHAAQGYAAAGSISLGAQVSGKSTRLIGGK